MKHHLRYIVVFMLVGLHHCAKAQFVNNGKVYVSEASIFSTFYDFDNHPAAEFYNNGLAYFHKDFNNDGVFDFTTDTGHVLFVGAEIQRLSGNSTSYFYNLSFNNSGQSVPFHLKGIFDIYGKVDFLKGIVDNRNYGGKITLESNTTVQFASDSSHVDGHVYKWGGQDFSFPIGDGGYYRSAGIATIGNSQARFKSEFIYKNPEMLYPFDTHSENIIKIDDQEFWVLEYESGGAENIFVTFSWHSVTSPAFIIEAANNKSLTIVRWDFQENKWIDEGGTISVADANITTKVRDLGVFTLASIETDENLLNLVKIYNTITANEDGINDYFRIEDTCGCVETMFVKIFNRWGVKVFETADYGIDGSVFSGYSKGRLTLEKDKAHLPTGTYFYVLSYKYRQGASTKTHQQAGYLYLSGN